MRQYVAIDLKSYYASVELADRKYDPLSSQGSRMNYKSIAIA